MGRGQTVLRSACPFGSIPPFAAIALSDFSWARILLRLSKSNSNLTWRAPFCTSPQSVRTSVANGRLIAPRANSSAGTVWFASPDGTLATTLSSWRTRTRSICIVRKTTSSWIRTVAAQGLPLWWYQWPATQVFGRAFRFRVSATAAGSNDSGLLQWRAQRFGPVGRLTIVGGGREAWPVWRRGRLGTVCARGADPAWSSGPSTSPLEDALDAQWYGY